MRGEFVHKSVETNLTELRKWKDVVGYEGYYEISTDGAVRNSNGMIMSASLNRGYPVISLSIDGFKKMHRVHRLVAQAFIPNPKNKPQVNHINGVKDDNRVENLEWSTPLENISHAYENGLKDGFGESCKLSVMTNEIVKYIIDNCRYMTINELCENTGIKATTIRTVVYKNAWPHIERPDYQLYVKPSEYTILNLETGVFFNSFKEAADSIATKADTLRRRLIGVLNNNTVLKLV